MACFAQIDSNNLVTTVIVADQNFIDSGAMGDPDSWIETSYGTRDGVHYDENGKPSADQSLAFRLNYAGIGYTYDRNADAFIPPADPTRSSDGTGATGATGP